MQTFDRGIKKWRPFNSLISNHELINSILKDKAKSSMPLLSEEQKSELEKAIMIAFYEQVPINIAYYYSGKIILFNDKIKKIDSIFHKIYFTNRTILFEQIINIY